MELNAFGFSDANWLLAGTVALSALFVGVQIGVLTQKLHSIQVMLNHYFQELLKRE